MKVKNKYQGFKTLEVLEGADNYNKWIADRIGKNIQSPALEIGAGTGNISTFFTNLGELVLTDFDQSLVRHLRMRFSDLKNIRTEVLNAEADNGKINNHFRTVYSVNVLEHIKDDQKALSNIYSMLEKSGKIVLLVPAKRRVYSKLDKKLGHYRRYEKEELRKKLEEANFFVEEVNYFNALGLISWVVRNMLTKNHNELKKSHVRMFDILVPVLRLIEPRYGLPFGISLIAVARKK